MVQLILQTEVVPFRAQQVNVCSFVKDLRDYSKTSTNVAQAIICSNVKESLTQLSSPLLQCDSERPDHLWLPPPRERRLQ